jgi:hypothetical protein
MTSYGPLAQNLRDSPELAKFFVEEHVRDDKGNCTACADFTTIPYPSSLPSWPSSH